MTGLVRGSRNEAGDGFGMKLDPLCANVNRDRVFGPATGPSGAICGSSESELELSEQAGIGCTLIEGDIWIR